MTTVAFEGSDGPTAILVRCLGPHSVRVGDTIEVEQGHPAEVLAIELYDGVLVDELDPVHGGRLTLNRAVGRTPDPGSELPVQSPS